MAYDLPHDPTMPQDPLLARRLQRHGGNRAVTNGVPGPETFESPPNLLKMHFHPPQSGNNWRGAGMRMCIEKLGAAGTMLRSEMRMLLVLALVLLPAVGLAQVPSTIAYQGLLTDDSDVPVVDAVY